MHVKRITTCLYVADIAAGAEFYVKHFGFTPDVVNDSVAKLGHGDPAFELCLLPTTSEFAPPGLPPGDRGVIVVLEVDDAAAELQRLQSAGVTITAPMQDDPWGERSFQVSDPNGITVQLVQWLTERPGS